jgi:DNA invertase Pin-like site-specific DNA recombinase
VADRRVEVDYIFDRLGEKRLVQAYRILVPERRQRTEGLDEYDHGSDLRASLLVSQKEEETIVSQTSALKEYATSLGLVVPSAWVFEDDGFSGSTLVRPALEELRDLISEVRVGVLLCYAPDRLARRYAYQVLLLEEFARAGTEVRFVKGPPADTPEAEFLVQVQGVIAEYEKAQILERTRRGKVHRAKAGSVSVLSGAPFGYRYVRKGPDTAARYEIVEYEARIVRELFRRYTEEQVSLRTLGKWLTQQAIPTAAGKHLWDHSTVRQLLRNPAYCGRAAFGRTTQVDERPRRTRPRRLSDRKAARRPARRMTPREHWIEIVVPAIVSDEVFELAARRFEDNRRFAARRTKEPLPIAGTDRLPTLRLRLLPRSEEGSRWSQVRLLSLRR